jgi:hypothetical protein
MEEFFEGQRWVLSHTLGNTFFGEVIEVFDDGASGTVVITDHQRNVVDLFSGSAASFLASAEWQLSGKKAR